ncbi:MAG: response regulator transcription factor [Lachnospiraceae bacterium]|nr:response regulator transcription factor [Lachnospiraceae bacterium]
MKITVTILEDQPIEVERLKNYLKEWCNENNFSFEANIFHSGEDYFANRKDPPDITNVFFLDVQMSKLTGIDVAKRLRQEGYQGYIIFLTAFKEYVFHGYEVHALNYLLKPVKPAQLFLCLDEIAKNLLGNSYFFRNKQESICIPYKDILCFSSSLHYVDILTVSETYCQYSSLNNIIDYLPQEFIRTHRSFIVNMAHIYKITGNVITLSNRTTVQIARSYMNQVAEAFAKYSARLDVKGGLFVTPHSAHMHIK